MSVVRVIKIGCGVLALVFALLGMTELMPMAVVTPLCLLFLGISNLLLARDCFLEQRKSAGMANAVVGVLVLATTVYVSFF